MLLFSEIACSTAAQEINHVQSWSSSKVHLTSVDRTQSLRRNTYYNGYYNARRIYGALRLPQLFANLGVLAAASTGGPENRGERMAIFYAVARDVPGQ